MVVGANMNRQSLNFGGTSDWAIDLQEEWADTHNIDGDDDSEDDDDWGSFSKCNEKYNSVEEIPSSTSGRCVAPYILGSLSKELAVAVKDYKEVSKGYDDKVRHEG